MGVRMDRDFASVLEELLAENDPPAQAAPQPTIPLDFLIDAIGQSFGPAFASGVLQKEYTESGEADAALPSTDPDLIARELGLSGARRAKDLDRLRRDFAFRNHPDRVAKDMRERAMIRMQIANRLIDEAKRRQTANP